MNCAVVIGSGSIATRHIRNLRDLYPKAEIVCCTSSGRKIEAFDIGATKIAQSLDEAISCGPDIAIVASPASLHLTHALPIVRANIPVLIEKPLCLNLEQLKAVELDATAKIFVGYNLRFLPAAKLVKEIISSRALGTIFNAYAEVGQYLPDWRPNSDYRNGVSAKKELGGGALLELSHELDYLNWFFDGFSEVSAKLGNSGLLDLDVEDGVDALMATKTGMVVYLHLDFLQRTASRSFKFTAEKGSLTWDLLKNEILMQEPGSEPTVVFSEPDYDRNLMYKDQLRFFIDGPGTEDPVAADWNSATEVMKLIESIRVADLRKTWVKLSSI